MIEEKFKKSLANVAIHDVFLSDGSDVQKNLVYMKYGDRYYFTNRQDGEIPTDPQQWSVVTSLGALIANKDKFHYYHDPDSGQSNHTADELEQIVELYRSVAYLHDREVFSPVNDTKEAIEVDVIADILMAKEQAGAALSSDFFENISPYIQDDIFDVYNERYKGYESSVNEEAEYARSNLEQALLTFATGRAFELNNINPFEQDTHQTIFYRFVPSEDESVAHDAGEALIQEDGTITPGRIQRVSIRTQEVLFEGKRSQEWTTEELEDIDLDDIVHAVLEKGIKHAPDAVTQYLNGDDAKLEQYVKKELHKLQNKDEVKKQLNITESSRDSFFGSEVPLSEATSYAWYRIFDQQNYHAQGAIDLDAPDHAITQNDQALYLNEQEADYFTIVPQPNGLRKYNLYFFKGNEEPDNPEPMEVVTCDSDSELLVALADRGISVNSTLIKIGDSEFSRFREHHNVDEQFNVGEVDNFQREYHFQQHVFSGITLSEDDLQSAISLSAEGEIQGDINELKTGVVYNVTENKYMILVAPHSFDPVPQLIMIERSGDDFIVQEPTGLGFQEDLARLLCDGAVLECAVSDEVMALASSLNRQLETKDSPTVTIGEITLNEYSSDKPHIPALELYFGDYSPRDYEEMVDSIQQKLTEQGGTLTSGYAGNFFQASSFRELRISGDVIQPFKDTFPELAQHIVSKDAYQSRTKVERQRDPGVLIDTVTSSNSKDFVKEEVLEGIHSAVNEQLRQHAFENGDVSVTFYMDRDHSPHFSLGIRGNEEFYSIDKNGRWHQVDEKPESLIQKAIDDRAYYKALYDEIVPKAQPNQIIIGGAQPNTIEEMFACRALEERIVHLLQQTVDEANLDFNIGDLEKDRAAASQKPPSPPSPTNSKPRTNDTNNDNGLYIKGGAALASAGLGAVMIHEASKVKPVSRIGTSPSDRTAREEQPNQALQALGAALMIAVPAVLVGMHVMGHSHDGPSK